MGHDIHFLERLNRVNSAQVELALELYRAPELVRELLETQDPGVERVAIALEAEPGSPHLVVARNGHFVTCLGEGMPPTGLPVIGRAALDRARSFRAGLSAAEEEGGRAALEARISDLGHRLDRQTVTTLLALRPLVPAPVRVECLFMLAPSNQSLRGTLMWTGRSASRGHRAKLVWENDHVLAFDWLLATAGGPEEAAGVDPAVAGPEWAASAGAVLTQSRLASSAVRLGWGAGQLGSAHLPAFAAQAAGASLTEALSATFGLAGIALAEPDAAPAALNALRAGVAGGRCALGPALCEAVEQVVADPLEATARALARGAAACVALGRRLRPGAPFRFEREVEVPPELALCLSCNLPEARLSDLDSIRAALDLLPWALARSGASLYLPGEATALLPDWVPELTLEAAETLRLQAVRPAARAAAEPGRNDRCPCGSGQKFKRCCALAPAQAA